MGNSFTPDCIYCGHKIRLVEMPDDTWRSYELDGSRHKCLEDSKAESGSSSSPSSMPVIGSPATRRASDVTNSPIASNPPQRVNVNEDTQPSYVGCLMIFVLVLIACVVTVRWLL